MSWELFECIDRDDMGPPQRPARIRRRRISTDLIVAVDEPSEADIAYLSAGGYDGDFCILTVDGASWSPYVVGSAEAVTARLNALSSGMTISQTIEVGDSEIPEGRYSIDRPTNSPSVLVQCWDAHATDDAGMLVYALARNGDVINVIEAIHRHEVDFHGGSG